ncbi:MAG: transglutaminase domain-containing protein [Spirochaetales bacterium]
MKRERAISFVQLAAQAILVALYARALGGLAAAPVLIVLLAVAASAGRLAARWSLRAWVVVATAAGGYTAIRALVLGVLSSLAVWTTDPRFAVALQQADAISVAAIPVVALGFLAHFATTRRADRRRCEPIVHGVLLLVLLWSQAHYSLSYFERPWAYVLVVGSLLILDLVLLIEPRHLRSSVVLRLAALAIPLLAAAVFLSFRWYAAGGTAAGGGILRPTLFRFDFAPFVRLESEISMNDDLVLLYRRSGRPRRELIRRFVLTEYDAGAGFSVGGAGAQGRADDPSADLDRERVRQEYFLVNLDPQTRLALNAPVEFHRFENWDESSFTAAFAAESLVSEAPPFRLARAHDVDPAPADLPRLTDYGENEAIRELAREIAGDASGPFAKARAIELYLQENYYYSLRPGIAADGDQLMHFLFESRKGYCSYYAFSMALMVRSLGIPARVAVGFFVDPSQEVLNFYPILANMAHAWVEVHLGEYGWIEFDPTSQTLAPGEEYEVGAGADPREVADLLEEVLAQELVVAEDLAAEDAGPVESSRFPPFVRTVIGNWYFFLPALFLLYVAAIRLVPFALPLFTGSPRGRTIVRVRATLRWLAACGIVRRADESLREFGRARDVDGLARLMELYERALFEPDSEASARRVEAAARPAVRAVLHGVRSRFPWWRRVLAFLDPRPHGRPRARAAGRLGAWVLVLATVLLVSPSARAQEPPEWYHEEATNAIRAERYDRAVDILQEAQRYYDQGTEFFMLLGDLYYDEELYELALEEYREAEERAPASYDVLDAIAFTLGLLNREAESAEYWARLAEIYPDRIDPAQNLGWLLFKLHRLEDGLAFMQDAWERFGPDADLAMTLGTIHAELYQFEQATEWYARSIDLATELESEGFIAVAFYNLSLIQKLFHRYEAALESTERSLAILSRPTGYLARGELHELRLDFSSAHADYLRAYEMDDDTPLGRLNLALLYQRFGRLDEALAFATSVFEDPDNSWLYYYGTDVSRHRMELHDLLAEIHDGLARSSRLRAVAGPIDRLARAWTTVRHRALAWYHHARFRGYAGSVARRIMDGGNLIDANWYLYRANEQHARVAEAYLRRARDLEVARIPDSAPYYDSELAQLRRDRARLLELADELDSPWQRQLLEETLVGALERRRVDHVDDGLAAALRLYAINPGALRQHGIRLPVRLNVAAAPPAVARRIRRSFLRAGFARAATDHPAVPELSVTMSENRLDATLVVRDRIVTAEAALAGSTAGAIVSAVNELAESLFRVQ